MEVNFNSNETSAKPKGCTKIWKGFGPNVQTKIIQNLQVLQVALGQSHCIILTVQHDVYAYGAVNFGQLGIPSDNDDEVVDPLLVQSLQGVDVVQVACGANNSAAIDSCGNLYMWGDNHAGQSAVESAPIVKIPKRVQFCELSAANNCQCDDLENHVRVEQIACGEEHTLALSRRGELWVWGTGSHLGVPLNKERIGPTRILAFQGRSVLSIDCGALHNLALVNIYDLEDSHGSSTSRHSAIDSVRSEPCRRQHSTPLKMSLAKRSSAPNETCPLGLSIDSVSSSPVERTVSESKESKSRKNIDFRMAAQEQEADGSKLREELELVAFQVTPSLMDGSLALTEPSINSDLSAINCGEISDIASTIEVIDGNGNCDAMTGDIRASSELQVCPPQEAAVASGDDETNCLSNPNNFQIISESEISQEPTRTLSTSSFIEIDSQSVKNFLSKQMANVTSTISPIASSIAKESSYAFDVARDTIAGNINNMAVNVVESFSFVSKQWGHKNNPKMPDERSERSSTSSIEMDCSDSLAFSRTSSLRYAKRHGGSKKFNRMGSSGSISNVQRVDVSFINEQLCGHLWKKAKHSIETEVWSWGIGHNGQLGLGDAVRRELPCCIRSLSGKGVVKIACGNSHCLAMTLDGQLYCWGWNGQGQLGFERTQEPFYSPLLLKLPDNSLVWDIATGHKHSIVVSNDNGEQQIYFFGKQECFTSLTECTKTSGPIHQPITCQGYRVRQVVAGGPFSACLMDRFGSGYLNTLYELSLTEHRFYCHLSQIHNCLILPFADSSEFSTLVSSAHGPQIQETFNSFLEVVEHVARNMWILTYLLRSPEQRCSAVLVSRVDSQMKVYSKYCCALCDTLAVNGFAACVKLSTTFFKSAGTKLQTLVLDKVPGDSLSAETFQHLLEEPIRRMSQYKKLFANLAQQRRQKSKPCHLEQEISRKWHHLVREVSLKKEQAELTRAFWDSCPQKIRETLSKPLRRVLRDSKMHPITYHGAGRFSSHWFILFNDILAHSQYSGVTTYSLPLVWVEPNPDTDYVKNGIVLTTPEETITLVCQTPEEKSEWMWTLNEAIKDSLNVGGRKASQDLSSSAVRLIPPLARFASYTFTKSTYFKDATYTGMWLCGHMQGVGELTWPDGKKYVGEFKQSVQHGEGTYKTPSNEGETVYTGLWKDGRMHGLGHARYPNGDVYEGYFKDNFRHGHGIMKHGQFLSSAANIYIGEWVNNHKHGYGVMDDITKGEKYLGMWEDDCHQGKGVLVTLDGMYFEGNFLNGKTVGHGLVFDDGCWFEGEVSSGPTFNGKGHIYLSNGDTMEGYFTGSLCEGVKVNGVFRKATQRRTSSEIYYPSEFGKLCVSPNVKWMDMFRHCREMLNLDPASDQSNTKKAWEAIAVALTSWKTSSQSTKQRVPQLMESLNALERIPQMSDGKLSVMEFKCIQKYLLNAFEVPYHPLGRILEGLVDVFRATYVGIGAHPCLLFHAVEEVRSFVYRLYNIVRVLFPSLPADGQHLSVNVSETVDHESEIVTPIGLLLPILLPRIYPSLFTLYVIHNDKEDEIYWDTVCRWNKQNDLSLMTLLGVDRKFWSRDLENNGQASTSPSQAYNKAIEALQQLSTTFCPREKLEVIQKTFEEMNKEVQMKLALDYLWTMDDLFPVFQFVVVRSRICHLGSEIHLIDDLMEKNLQNGELGIMFTMLKACYFQIRTEKSLA